MNTMKLTGVTTTNGGTYENVQIEGVAKINDDIKCAEMRIEGVSTFEGSIECTDMHVQGTCKVMGGVRGGSCRLEGLLTVEKDVEVEHFAGTGSFQVGGALNAETIDVRFVYGSAAGEVGGENILIRKEKHSAAAEFVMDLIPWRHKGRSFRCTLIEGDKIDVEHVDAATVRGRHVKIGAECRIDLVEYHDTLDIEPGATVKKSVKLGE